MLFGQSLFGFCRENFSIFGSALIVVTEEDALLVPHTGIPFGVWVEAEKAPSTRKSLEESTCNCCLGDGVGGCRTGVVLLFLTLYPFRFLGFCESMSPINMDYSFGFGLLDFCCAGLEELLGSGFAFFCLKGGRGFFFTLVAEVMVARANFWVLATELMFALEEAAASPFFITLCGGSNDGLVRLRLVGIVFQDFAVVSVLVSADAMDSVLGFIGGGCLAVFSLHPSPWWMLLLVHGQHSLSDL
jgi:hypothetical protein